MAEFDEYTKVMRLSRVEIGQMHEIAYLTRDAYENKRSQSFLQGKLAPLLKAIGVGSSVATIMKLPVPVPAKLTLAILSLSGSFITGTDYYFNILKQGERDLLKAKQWYVS